MQSLRKTEACAETWSFKDKLDLVSSHPSHQVVVLVQGCPRPRTRVRRGSGTLGMNGTGVGAS